MTKKLHEAVIDKYLKAAVDGADLGDRYQARSLHRMLHLMLMEAEQDQIGKWWLTDYGKKVLAEMHYKLGQSPERGDGAVSVALDAIKLTPCRGGKRNIGNVTRDIEITLLVVAEQMLQEQRGNKINITQACKNLAERAGDDFLKPRTIENIYKKVRDYHRGKSSALVPAFLEEQLPWLMETLKRGEHSGNE